MATTEAITGQGTKFLRGQDEIAEINSISGPTMSRETIDVTTLNDVSGYRKIIGGLRDAGTVSLGMNFTRATYEQMKDDFESDTEQEYTIKLPDDDATELTFNGLVTECPLDIPIGEKITADITIQISGEVDISVITT